MIKSLSTGLPTLWNAPGTTAADRQTIIRHLVDRVVVDVQGESERVDVAIHWSGGFVSQHEVIRPVASFEQLSGYKELMVRVEELRRSDQTSVQIAEQLNSEGFHSPRGKMIQRKDNSQIVISPRSYCKIVRHRNGGRVTWRRSWTCRLAHFSLGCVAVGCTASNWNGAHGRWILWADNDEVIRLNQLREHRQRSPGLPAPAELTTPKPLHEN